MAGSNQGYAPNDVQFAENMAESKLTEEQPVPEGFPTGEYEEQNAYNRVQYCHQNGMYFSQNDFNQGYVPNGGQLAVGNQRYSTTQYGGIQENSQQEHQGYNNTWYQNDFNQGYVPNGGQLAVGNQGYSTTQYGGIQENSQQEHQGYNNTWYQNDFNQGYVPNGGQLAVGNQRYSTTQYGGIQENSQDHQGYNNTWYQNDFNQGYVPNGGQLAVGNQGYSSTQYGANQENWQEHQGYNNTWYQNDFNQDTEKIQWHYIDLSGNEQGPFTCARMLQWYQDNYFPPAHMVKRMNIDLEFIPLNVMIQWYEGRVPFTSGVHPPGPATVTATEENASGPAENVENENPMDMQNILEPIHLAGTSINGRWKCPSCPLEAKQKGYVTRHIKTKHLGIRNYKCEECNEAFHTKQNLDIHMRTHTGEKPFACPQCDYRATVKGHLVGHMRIHTREKPFPCPQCDYRFALSHNLKQHIKRVHGGN